jgi:hypothetical protein
MDICLVDQEKGHTGRWPGASSKTGHYAICGLLKSYIQLVGAPLVAGGFG